MSDIGFTSQYFLILFKGIECCRKNFVPRSCFGLCSKKFPMKKTFSVLNCYNHVETTHYCLKGDIFVKKVIAVV